MGRPVPCTQPGKGDTYLELDEIPADEVLEIIRTSGYLSWRHTLDINEIRPVTYLLVTTLRERLYSVTKYVYSRRKRSFADLRQHATRSFANLRDSLRRTITPAASQH